MKIRMPFDMIMMDCEMPVMDGYAASIAIKKMVKENKIPNVKIIALTGNVTLPDLEHCKAHKMDFTLGKPVMKKDLFNQLNVALGFEAFEFS